MNERIATPTPVVLDKERSFLLTFRAIRKIKTWTGKNLLDPRDNPLAGADPDGVLAVVAGLLLHEDPAMTPERAEPLIDKAAGITYVMAQIKDALVEYGSRGVPNKENAPDGNPTIAS